MHAYIHTHIYIHIYLKFAPNDPRNLNWDAKEGNGDKSANFAFKKKKLLAFVDSLPIQINDIWQNISRFRFQVQNLRMFSHVCL